MSRRDKSNKGLWIGIGIAIVAALVGLVLWLKSKNDEYIEEYYEYFDDDLTDDEEDLYNEDEDDIAYVEIKHFAEAADQEEASEAMNHSEEVNETETEIENK